MIAPPVVIDHSGIRVVRDDLLEGGTKTRALPAVFDSLDAASEVVYASPATGYAQIAIAIAARLTGRTATIFVAERRLPHDRTVRARAAGARIVQIPHGYLSNVQSKARAHCAATGATLLPFGLDVPALTESLASIAAGVCDDPPEVWCVAGSGALSRALQAAWPSSPIVAVQVGRDPKVGRAELLVAPEAFERPARLRPPFPSCDSMDAKAWQFLSNRAQPGALFWNVGA